MTETPTDTDLYDAWCEGNSESGAALIELYFVEVRRFFANKCGDELDDLVQQTFLRLIESRDRFEKRASFRAFVFGVARYVLYEYYRGRARNQERALDFSESTIFTLQESPSQAIVREAEQQRVLLALRQIPIELQVALELFYWEELTTRELAQVLETPEGTVKRRISRGRERLARVLSHQGSRQSLIRDLQALRKVVAGSDAAQ